jgi:hypothetical protein
VITPPASTACARWASSTTPTWSSSALARHARRAWRQGEFIKADLFETDFSEATVVTMYLLTTLNLKLRPKILGLKPGTRIVSHAFDMGDWKPDRTETVESRSAYLWIVPAKVAGDWQLPQG